MVLYADAGTERLMCFLRDAESGLLTLAASLAVDSPCSLAALRFP